MASATDFGEETVLLEDPFTEGSETIITSPAAADHSGVVEKLSQEGNPELETIMSEQEVAEKVTAQADEPPIPAGKPPAPAPAPEQNNDTVAEEKKETDSVMPQPTQTADETEEETEIERDFDADPTELYRLIQKKEWSNAVMYAQQAPEEARIWVSRREKDGRLRWRLLPIHAAIIFKAPESVIETLLAAYPKGAQSKDDQGMLPLHLAFRNGSSEGVVNLLLVAFPQSIEVKDRKGRIPLVLAQASTSPNKEAFMRALERGPTYYAVAAAATERAAVTAEQRAIFDAKLMQVRQSHQHELATVQIEAEKKQNYLQDKVDELEKELLKTQETSQVLVDHVNSLEAQLNSRSDTERFLATKIASLDSNLKDTTKSRTEVETKLKADNYSLTLERDSLKAKAMEAEIKYDAVKEKLTYSVNLFEKREAEWLKTEKELSAQVKTTELDWANAQANCAILEAQLKKKMETEHALATQVSALAGKLAESAAEGRDNSNKFAKRIHELEDERLLLRSSVQDLTKRLALVARVLEDMTQQQASLIQNSKGQEEQISATLKSHAKIVADAMSQEMELEKAKQERERLRVFLERQEVQATKNEEKRLAILNAIAVQGKHMDNTRAARKEVVETVKTMEVEIKDMLANVLNVVPKDLEAIDKDKNRNLVDVVVQRLNAPVEEEAPSPATEEATPAPAVEEEATTAPAVEEEATPTPAPAVEEEAAAAEESPEQATTAVDVVSTPEETTAAEHVEEAADTTAAAPAAAAEEATEPAESPVTTQEEAPAGNPTEAPAQIAADTPATTEEGTSPDDRITAARESTED